MSWREDRDFLAALDALEGGGGAPRRRRPTRFDARALLVPLGTALVTEDADSAEALSRVRAVVDVDRPGWGAAIQEELELAATEHVRSCDPAYLQHPRYDFVYTLEARERLEARLRAAQALDFPLAGSLKSQIERADRILAPHARKWESGGADTAPHS